MFRRVAKWIPVAAILVASTATTSAQGGAGAKPPAATLKVDVVLSRSLGDKKISSLPFTLWINSDRGQQSLRVGVDVPVGTSQVTRGPGPGSNVAVANTTTTNQVEYRNIGTSVDGRVEALADGRFQVYVAVSDSSVFGADATNPSAIKNADATAYRTFRMDNGLPMRDGQSLQFGMATDKTSGETLKVDVTLTVIK